MKIRVECDNNGTMISAEAYADVTASGEDLQWLVNVFKKLVEEGILLKG